MILVIWVKFTFCDWFRPRSIKGLRCLKYDFTGIYPPKPQAHNPQKPTHAPVSAGFALCPEQPVFFLEEPSSCSPACPGLPWGGGGRAPEPGGHPGPSRRAPYVRAWGRPRLPEPRPQHPAQRAGAVRCSGLEMLRSAPRGFPRPRPVSGLAPSPRCEQRRRGPHTPQWGWGDRAGHGPWRRRPGSRRISSPVPSQHTGPDPTGPAASRRWPGAGAARCAASWGARNGGPRGPHTPPPLSERLSRPWGSSSRRKEGGWWRGGAAGRRPSFAAIKPGAAAPSPLALPASAP